MDTSIGSRPTEAEGYFPPAKPAQPFLDRIYGEIGDIRQRLGILADRLHSAGFYGPPEIAAKNTDHPTEDNIRGNITEDVTNISHLLRRLEHQVGQVI